MQNSFEENPARKSIQLRSITYYTKKLKKSTILESQQQRICAQMILNHLQDQGCEKPLLDKLENFFNQRSTPKRGSQMEAANLSLQNLIAQQMTPSHETLLQKAMVKYVDRKAPQSKRLSRLEIIRGKSQSLQQLNGARYHCVMGEQPIEYMHKLKTCFGHALHPDNQDQEDPYIPVYNIIYDRTGQLLLTGDDMGLIKIWSASNGLLLQSLKGHTMAINSMDISFCNKYLASCSNDGLVIVWEIQTGRPIAALKETQDDPILVLVFYQGKSQSHLAVASEKGQVYIYDLEDIIKCNGSILGTQFNGKIKESAIKHRTEIIRLNVNVQRYSKNKYTGILCMEFNKYGYLALGTESGDIAIFDKPELLKQNSNPRVELREHSAQVHLARWSREGDQLLTASYDGSARLWKWNSGELITNQNPRSSLSLKYKSTEGRRVGEIHCLAIAWSAKTTYALASFSKQIKKKGDEEKAKTQIQVYSTVENAIINCIDQETYPQLKMDYKIVLLETHPHIEEVALSADENGLIILWNVRKGLPLKVFHERGYHLKLPNLEVPLLDGCFSPNGMTFVVSTDFGSFSIYGYGVQEIFDQTPIEQFYVSDSEHPIIEESDGFRVLALDSDMEFCYVDRGSICNFYRMPYQYTFHNNFRTLFPILMHMENQGKKSVNLQKPKQLLYIQMSKGIANDNMKNEEMFQGYFQEMKINEKKILDETKQTYLSRENDLIQQTEKEILEVFTQPQERSPSSHKILKKTEQKSNELAKRAFLKNDKTEEESSPQVSLMQVTDSKKQSRKKKVIESESEESNHEVEQSPRQTRNRRNQRPQQLRLQILNNHRQQTEIRRNRSQVSEQCTRCRTLIESVVRCPECKSAYHQECSEVRLFLCELEFGTQKKICVNCIAQLQRKKQSMNRIGNHQREKYLINDTNVPQIGDDVIFFAKGYEAYLQKNLHNLDLGELLIDQNTKKTIVFPGDVFTDQESANFVYCKLINVNYIFPVVNSVVKRQAPQSSCIIQVLELQSKYLVFKTLFSYDCDPYLILEQAYEQSVKQIRPHLSILPVTFQTDADKESGLGHQYSYISQETPDEYLNTSDWQVLKCKRVAEDSYQLRNQKSMTAYVHLNFWEIASMITKNGKPIEIQGASLQSALTTPEVQQITKEITSMIKRQSRIAYFFLDAVDIRQYPEYLEHVPLMSYISLILSRLEEDYYRSKEQIMNDVERIKYNAYIFNPPKSEVCELADKLVLLLSQIISGEQTVREISIRKKKKIF